MSIARRFAEDARDRRDRRDVRSFKKDVEFSAQQKYMNPKGFMEYLFADRSVLAIPFTSNLREDGEVKSIDFTSLEGVREAPCEGFIFFKENKA
jgi:hypothetical protein